MNDNLIECARCSSDSCYTMEISDTVTIYQCFGCGFSTSTLMKKGELFFEEQMEFLPNLYKELMGEDEEGKIWIPTYSNNPSSGMVFVDGTSIDDWEWVGVLAVPIKEEEKLKYPLPGKTGEYYKWRMDMSTLKRFGQSGYTDALEYAGFIKTEE